MLVAAKSGRLDVIKILIESGVEIRQENIVEYIYQEEMMTEDRIYMHIEAEVDAFSLACEADEEVAQFMILNGLDLRYRDLWWPVEFGRMQVLEILLQYPLFKTKEGQDIIEVVLDCIVYKRDIYPIRDFSVLKSLLDAMTDPSFNKIEWLERATAKVLGGKRSSYKDALGMYLFDLFKNSGTKSICNPQIARQAAGSDNFLEITKTILLEAEHSKKSKNGKTLPWIHEMMKQASRRICPRTVMYLLSSGYKFSKICLHQAVIGPLSDSYKGLCESMVYTNQLELIDMLVNSGISVNSFYHFPRRDEETLLEYALKYSPLVMTRDGRQGLDCRVALRLMHYGADPTKVGEDTIENWLNRVYQDKYLTDYFLHEIPHKNDLASLGRDIFSHKVSSVDSPLYIDQIYAMAVMMKGKDFLESCLKEVGVGWDHRYRNSEWLKRPNGFRGSPMDRRRLSLDAQLGEGIWVPRKNICIL
ncbi:hypothetical protein F4813DRAFT_389037 [Daldinia decipiens]|uniref:uncharacterized protein n=1 Tax=Daldinia decipiens TaxID=326647 RepID=UPI0020C55DF0|nr:uncharacterized protein F4813DRAFT_389037 [Daldinia decipiens]KAI1658257.1 hypothetical protein F4813DRAFT_389037 [Daldinia decipiens]